MIAMRTDSIGRIWTVARRDIKALMDHPTGYVLLIVFGAINAFLFFRQAYITGVASLRPMIDLLPWVFLFFVPAVGMRALAEDARGGVLEVVLTQPITELELVVGKFVGVVLFLWLALALTLAIPLGLALGSDMQWGPVVAQYMGAALLACGLSGVAIWASSLARSQITAFIIAVSVMFVLILVGLDPLIVGLPPALGAIAARLGVLSHFDSMGRGVIDLRDVVYFLSLSALFVLLAYGSVVSHKLARKGVARQRLRLGIPLAAAMVLVLNLLGGYIGGRLDLSPGGAFTLSRPTKQLVRGLDDIVTIKLFASKSLPTSAALMERELNDLLRDLRAASHGKVRVVRRDPSDDHLVEEDAQRLGVQPVQFNVYGSSELQVKEGYLGLAIQYGSGSEAIPFVDRTDDLEFRLASSIRNLTRAKKPAIAIVSDGQTGGALTMLRSELEKSYVVRDVSPGDSIEPGADVSALVLVGSPESVPPGFAVRMRAFLARGGGALVLANGAELSPQMPLAMPRPVGWNEILAGFGVSVHSDVVYDLSSNEVIPAGNGGPFQVLQRYPFFVRAGSTGAARVNQDISDVLIPWPSSVDTTASLGWKHTPLLVTTEAAGVSTGETMIEPSRDFPRTDLARRILAVQVTPASDSVSKGRIIVVGSNTFISDNFAQHAPENLAFVLNSIDWLSQDAALIAIRSRELRPPQIKFTSPLERDAVKYANVVALPALTAFAGFVRLTRRRRSSREPYHRASEGARGETGVEGTA